MNKITKPIPGRFLPLHLDNLVNPVHSLSLRHFTND